MNNKLYNILKWLVITGLPATEALIIGLGLLYGFNTTLIAGTIALVTTFIGTCIGIDSIKYFRDKSVVNNEDLGEVTEIK